MSADSTGADLLLRSPVQHAVSVANMAHTDAVAKSVEDSDLTMSILEEMRVQFEFKAFGINRHSATGVPTGSPKSAKTSILGWTAKMLSSRPRWVDYPGQVESQC